MADAVLQFTIKAKDEASRVVKGATDSIQGDVKALDSTVGKLAQSFGFSTSQAAALSKALPVVGAAAGVVAGAVTAAGAAVFALAKRASDTGSAIDEFSDSTNLSVEFLSALKVEAEQSGSSLETTAAKVNRFASALVAAAKGNETFTADLKRFGLDAAEAYRNPEESLKSLIETFNKLPPSAANNAAVMRLFKDRTGEIIPVLRAFGTDYDALVGRLDKAGLIWTKEGVDKADEFGDALTELGQVADGIGNVFAREFMPDVTTAMKDISKSVAENRETVKAWGKDFGDVIRGVRELADSHLGTVVGWLAKVAYYTTPAAMLVGQVGAIGAGARDAEALANFGPFGGRGVASPLTTGRAGAAPTSDEEVVNEKAAREAARKSEQARKEALRQIEAFENAKERAYKKTIDAVRDAERDVLREIEQAKKRNEQLDKEAAERRLDASDAVRAALSAEIAILTDENTHLTAINETIRRAEILGAIDARTAAFARQLAVVNQLAQVPIDAGALGGAAGALGVGDLPQGAGQEQGPWVDPATVGVPPPPNFDPWKESLNGLKDVAKGVFGGISQGFGAMIQNFLMGEKGAAKSFGAIAKAAISSMAAQAAVSALFELAQGFAWLFIAPPKAAAHFQAAAVFGIVAGMAGAASALIPGGGSGAADFGGGGSAFGSSGGFASGGAGRDRAINEPRRGGMSDPNEAQAVGYMVVDVKHDDGHTERQMVKVWKRMGEFRDTVMAGTVGTAPSY